ncbi:MAG: polyhydroxyalkanoate synthesis regulator DNA-binding domain-containing protein [Terracidiphilus sp.]
MAQKTVVIKKYENRRLYDTTNSRYVNLEEVAQMLRQGNDLQVIDAASGDDITRLILTQIIVEDAKIPESNFPLDLLRQMVIASGRASQESALKYMKAMSDLYQNTYRAMPGPLNPFEFMQNLRVNQATHEDRIPPERSEPPRKARSNDKKQPDFEEVRELKRRLAELEKHVSTFVPPKSRRKRK